MQISIFKKYRNEKWFNAATHILFWSAFFFFPHMLFNLPYTLDFLFFRLIEVTVLLTIFYTNAYVLVPKMLARRKYIAYLLVVFAVTIPISELGVYAKKNMPDIQREQLQQHNHHNDCISNQHFHDKSYRHPKPAFISIIVMVAFAFSATYGFVRLNNKREDKLKDLEKDQLSSELSFLKSQINPHFLFNVLNSIYSLSLKKSEKLPDVILRLSDLLRYMTYESEDKFVNIEKEISYIQNYIELQKLRLSAESHVQLSIFNNNNQTKIAPLILITFIENAFKHGVLSNSISNIDIELHINASDIELLVVNEFNPSIQKDKTQGIGIQNVKRRLEIMYPDKYSLDITAVQNQYSVKLKIQHS